MGRDVICHRIFTRIGFIFLVLSRSQLASVTTVSMARFLVRYFQSGRRAALIDSAIAVMIATVALAAFIGVAELVPSVWRFPDDGVKAAAGVELRRCEALADQAQRLACYDQIAEHSAHHPAKGAKAPAAFAPAHRSDANR
jgi:hypothetical protein